VSPLTSWFVNFNTDRSTVAPKTRKPRKDKGVPQDPRKGKETQSRNSSSFYISIFSYSLFCTSVSIYLLDTLKISMCSGGQK
jgi:hypothetical protein